MVFMIFWPKSTTLLQYTRLAQKKRRRQQKQQQKQPLQGFKGSLDSSLLKKQCGKHCGMACFLGQSEPLDGKRQPTQLFFELRPLRPYYICTSFLSSSSHDTTNCITTTQLCQQLLLAIVAKHNSAPSYFSLFCISQASHPHHAGYYIRRNLFKQIYLQVILVGILCIYLLGI